MTILIIGLLVFLGLHSVNILSPQKRQAFVGRLGEKKWKLIYSVISLIGLFLIIRGYGESRLDPTWLWMPPAGLRHLALLLTVPAFILLAAAYVPNNRIKAKLQHPMFAAVKIWAFAHLLANGSLADVLLFGSFLVWAIAGFAVSRRRDRMNNIQQSTGTAKSDITTVLVGVVSWAVFAMLLHTLLIGVNPLP